MKKMIEKTHIFIVRKRAIWIAVILLFILAAGAGAFFLLGAREQETSTPFRRPVVVLDAGHGGIDVGVTGKGGLRESDFNLRMVFLLRDLFTEGGFSVVLTRTDENGLYSAGADNFKRDDMKRRKEIIAAADPDLFISVHANKYPSSDRRGAQAFYDEFNPTGKALAEAIQEQFNRLNEVEVGRKFAALKGDYFVLKCTHAPSVIVECGFLSNQEDERLLGDENYRKKLAEGIFSSAVEVLAGEAH